MELPFVCKKPKGQFDPEDPETETTPEDGPEGGSTLSTTEGTGPSVSGDWSSTTEDPEMETVTGSRTGSWSTMWSSAMSSDWTSDGPTDGSPDGSTDGSSDGTSDGTSDGSSEVTTSGGPTKKTSLQPYTTDPDEDYGPSGRCNWDWECREGGCCRKTNKCEKCPPGSTDGESGPINF